MHDRTVPHKSDSHCLCCNPHVSGLSHNLLAYAASDWDTANGLIKRRTAGLIRLYDTAIRADPNWTALLGCSLPSSVIKEIIT